MPKSTERRWISPCSGDGGESWSGISCLEHSMESWPSSLTQPHARFDGRPPSRPLESTLPTMVAGKVTASETEQAKVEVKPGDLLKLSLSLDLHEAGGSFHPPTQEATAVKLWRNVQWVSSDPSARAYGRRAEALAKENALRRVPPRTQKGPRLPVLRSSLLRRMDQAVRLHRGRCLRFTIHHQFWYTPLISLGLGIQESGA